MTTRVLNRFGEYVDPDHPSLQPSSPATAHVSVETAGEKRGNLDDRQP
jgi:hypothetical protein